MTPTDAADPAELPTAIGSTEPTVEEMCHWTPEMRALAARDGVTVSIEGCQEVADSAGAPLVVRDEKE